MSADEAGRASEPSRGMASGVADALRGRILSGDLAAGSQLPTEAALTEEFGVSRTVVREAIQHLRAGGLVESFRGRGTFVLVVPTQPEGGLLDGVRSLRDVVELLEFRIGMETEAASLAAQRRTEDQLRLMRRALAVFETVGHEPERAVQADFDFHAGVAAASNNGFFVRALAGFGPRMILLQRTGLDERSELTSAAHLATVLAEHRQVEQAIARGDAPAAAAAMRIHLSNSRARLRP